MGEYLYNIKYNEGIPESTFRDCINDVIFTIGRFISRKNWIRDIKCIVPAPPSIKRKNQPIHLICRQLAIYLDIPYIEALYKLKLGRPIKNIEDYEERKQELRDNLRIIESKKNAIRGQNILFIDDIFDSGATLRRSVEVLLQEGACKVFALALTRTKRAGKS